MSECQALGQVQVRAQHDGQVSECQAQDKFHVRSRAQQDGQMGECQAQGQVQVSSRSRACNMMARRASVIYPPSHESKSILKSTCCLRYLSLSDSRIEPRASAYAERLWRGPATGGWVEAERRLVRHRARLVARQADILQTVL